MAKHIKERIDRLLAGSTVPSDNAGSERTITEADASHLDRIIEGVELGVEQMRVRLEQQERATPREYCPHALSVPFTLVNRNQPNSFKNFPRHWLDAEGGRAPRTYSLQHGQFSYDIVPERFARERQDVFGQYDARYNLVRMPEGFNPSSPFALIPFYHEMVHVAQGSQLRARMGEEAFRNFYDGSKRIILPFEIEAYGLQFEMMDRLLGGWLRAGAAAGASAERMNALMSQLKAQEQHRWLAQNILAGMKIFFPHGWRDDRSSSCSSAFADAMRRTYAPEGQLYTLDARGLPVPLR
ncbi:MAG: hypothetical protein Q7S29_05010 [Candidatus Peribacter sp.]|nr:hypothetical protein [Candidatus Peribacter sp.]